MGARLILGFAISFLVFIVGPALLPQPLAVGPVPRWGDALDLLTPIVLVSGYYLLLRSADDWASEPPAGAVLTLFIVGTVLFIDGHGMHLAANSIGHFLEDRQGSEAYAIAYFYDEVLSHYMRDLGVLCLALALIWRNYQPVKKGIDMWHVYRRQRWAIAVAALLYGLTVALMTIEGQTVPLTLPAAVAIAAFFGLSWRRQQHLPGGPVATFFGLGYVASAALLAGWGVYWGGFPEFSELGIIK